MTGDGGTAGAPAAPVLVAGATVAAVEGIGQALAAAGFRPVFAAGIDAALAAARREAPLAVLLERTLAESAGDRLAAARPAAYLLWRANEPDDRRGRPDAPLASALHRLVVGELRWPVERQRLVALLRALATRAAERGAPAADRAAAAERERHP